MSERLWNGVRSINDPDVMEDIQFLIDAGVHIEDIAIRANVGRAALSKANIKDRMGNRIPKSQVRKPRDRRRRAA